MITRFAGVVGAVALLALGGGVAWQLAAPPSVARAQVAASVAHMPLAFVPNRGQLPSRYAYGVEGADATVLFGDRGVTYVLGRNVLRQEFVGARAARPVARGRRSGLVSFFRGPRSSWRTGLPMYARVVYRDLWPGVDLVWSGPHGRLDYSFLVRPGADVRAIRLRYRGASALRVDARGSLVVRAAGRRFRGGVPVARQGHRRVSVAYRVDGRVVSFALGRRDRTQPLLIDPPDFVYAGFVGGSGDDLAYGVAVDATGAAYVAGRTTSPEGDLPVTGGPGTTYQGGVDAFVAKVRPDGTGFVYLGYVGGSSFDVANAVTVDSAGAAYVAGWTYSTDFPAIGGMAAVSPCSANSDAFVARVAPTGTSLEYAGCLGGTSTDYATAVAVDAAGRAYVGGQTGSRDFPAAQALAGSSDGFIARVDAAGSGFDYVDLIGGAQLDEVYGVAVDATGAAYLAGETQSDETTFPVARGPDLTANGDIDGFVAKVKPDGNGFDYAGYLGGTGVDRAFGVAVDATGAAYIGGESFSADFPVSGGPDTTINGTADAIVAKVKPDGSGLDYAGFVGGTNFEQAEGIAIDAAGDAYLTGFTQSPDFPSVNAPEPAAHRSQDGFVTKVRADGTALDYSTYIGGDGLDRGHGIAVDSAGNAYVAGETTSAEYSGFPARTGPDTSANGGAEAFVAKIGSAAPLPPPTTTTAGTTTASATTTTAPTTATTTTAATTTAATTTTATKPTTTASAPPAPEPAPAQPVPAPPVFRPPMALHEVAVARSATMAHGVWLNASAALPADTLPAEVAKIEWDTNGDKHYDWQCSPFTTAISVAYAKPGPEEVTLRVTTVAGAVAERTQVVNVTSVEATNDPRPSLTPPVDCENPGANVEPDRTDCVKSFAFGIVDVNSQGDGDDCFRITPHLNPIAFQTGTRALAGTKRAAVNGYWTYSATIKGPVLLNGLYVAIPESVTSVYDSLDSTVGLGTAELSFGSWKTVPVRLAEKIVPDRHGVFHAGDLSLGGAIPKIGGLSLDAKITLDLLYRQSRITFHIKLPNIFQAPGGKSVEGDLVVIVRNGAKLVVDGGKLGPLDALIGPMIVKRLQFTYSASQDSWSGGAEVRLLGDAVGLDAAPPPPDKGFGMKHGQFDHAGLGVVFADWAQPQVFPGLFLKHIDIAMGVNPLRFEGSAGFSAAKVANIDGEVFVAFASPDDPYTIPDDAGDLAPLAGRDLTAFSIAIGGTVSIHVPVLDDNLALERGYFLYEYPSLFEFAGGFNFDVSFLHVDGGVRGFIDGESGKWSMEAGLNGCLRHIKIVIELNICQSVGGVISSKGIAFCTTFPIPAPPLFIPVPVPIGVGYEWGGSVTPMVFDCDYGPWRETVPGARFTASARAARSVTLPASLPAAMFRVVGVGGVPDVTVRTPDRRTFSTAETPTDPDVRVVQDPDDATTIVAIRKPAAGTWTVTPAGSVPVARIESANGLAAPNVRAHVEGAGASRALRYALTAAPGRTVTFAELGAHSYRVLGVARGASGTIPFRPAPGSPGPRRIIAVVEENGYPIQRVAVATFAAAPEQRPARPRGLHVRRTATNVVVRWNRVPAATGYATVLTVGGAARTTVVTRRPVVRLGWIDPRERAVVSVRALGRDGVLGTPATALLRR